MIIAIIRHFQKYSLKGTVTQVLQVEINLNLALRGKNGKGDVFRIFDFGRKHR